MVTRREMIGGMVFSAAAGEARAEDSMDEMLRSQNFSGAVLARRQGRLVHRAAYGLANAEHNVANSPDTRFPIASISKTMTAGAVLKLAAAGRIDLDALVSRYIDAPASWRGITVSQLLNHSDGLPDVVRQPDFGERMLHRVTLAQTIAWLRTLPLAFTPGTDVAYGNSGHIVAAGIVEQVSGQAFSAFLSREIYAPLGMTNSGFADNEQVIPRLANGYRAVDGELRRPDFIDMSVTIGAGSEFSTVDDLALWIERLQGGALAPPRLTRRMFTPSADVYGMSWSIERFEGKQLVSHIGDINGFCSYLGRLPNEDLTVVLLSNMERTPTRDIALALARQTLAA